MNLQKNPIAIVSSACRLPLGITSPSQLWDAFCNYGDSRSTFTSPESVPGSRKLDNLPRISSTKVGGAGWLGPEGIESFDPNFFNISPAEAEVLRPNARLALELTWELLERAGIPPASLRERNVAVSIGMGTEDGWDIRRFSDDKFDAFDHRWAANSDPSGVSGRVSHFFDFRGPTSVISSACSSGSFALRDGIQSLLAEDCEFAIVGAVTTHFVTAPFDWAASVNVASKRGQCAAFSDKADGYVPSEGAVFFLLRKLDLIGSSPVLGVIRSLATGHNGATRTLTTPNVSAESALMRRSLRAAGLSPSEINILEAHGTGTRLGDAIEAEAFRNVYDTDEQRQHPLWISSSKTLFGHCQAASMFVGILKVLACFANKAISPHLVDPLPEFKEGQILIPTTIMSLPDGTSLSAQVCSFGFTGSISSLVLQEGHDYPVYPQEMTPDIVDVLPCILPFSAKTASALDAQIQVVYDWACETGCRLYDLGALLSLCREHHAVRVIVVVYDIRELRRLSSTGNSQMLDDSVNYNIPREKAMAFLNFPNSSSPISKEIAEEVNVLLEKDQVLHAACLLYTKGHWLRFDEIYDLRNVVHLRQYLQTFPTYAFDRKPCWRRIPDSLRLTSPIEAPAVDILDASGTSRPPSMSVIAEHIASVLRIPLKEVPYDINIYDLGIDSLNSIELSKTLSQEFGIALPTEELYSLLTVQDIYSFFSKRIFNNTQASVSASNKRFSQADVDAWIEKYGASLAASSAHAVKENRSSKALTVLLTGANGMLGSRLLQELLLRPSVIRIFCPVRGDAWERLLQSYADHGRDVAQLRREKEAGRVVVFPTSDLGDEHLGCNADVYHELLQNVDTIIHLAWKLDFNAPVTSFQNCIEGTRNLALLCAAAKKHVAYYFTSSFSAYFGFEDALLPEQPLIASLGSCLDQGYALSKLIAEHALFSMYRSSEAAFSLRVVRIGQICGDSVTGDWSLNEMMPMMIKALPVLGVLPRNMPDVTWIPSDVCATVLAEFATSPMTGGEAKVLHVSNPRITPWPTVSKMLAKVLRLNNVALVTLREYVDIIRAFASHSELRIIRLLPYFTNVVKQGELPSRYALLEVKESLAHSTALAACPAMDEEVLQRIVTRLMGTGQRSPAPLGQLPESPVLLFGPWSEFVASSIDDREAKARIQSIALQTRIAIQYSEQDTALDSQLATLASQVAAFERLKSLSVQPKAVLGYCFGEYAASVCAGILSLETAVDIIVRRAVMLRDVKGSMLNVFAEINAVKRQMLKLPFNMEIAIHAGPKHYVLSGPPAHITTAQTAFHNMGIKTKIIETSIPFHSALMDQPMKTLQLPDFDRHPGSCLYVSGLTGSSIGGKRLGPKYWLRHMRDPVLFVDAVRHIREHFPSSTLIDMGPGHMLSSMISRFNWDGCRIFSLEKFLAGNIPRLVEQRSNSDLGQRKTETVPEPAVTPPTASATGKMNREKAEAAFVAILVSDFGFRPEESQSLFSKSFVMLGLQSLDFVSFSEKVLASIGLVIPASAFVADATLSEILTSLVD
ncbi:ketoacyl-synt-domain-containing protein [Fomitiporia mediterranea MF3/22]|uniref:ketoacyl-synt-domain-containing protein n=1 Tax=Fomitiporia mediterranea (strain MF3/22) TaxID=694068 RepID=UPI0004409537|nr:ketoacyl-synt-domain-containing protein [Fomitiporia mediterranea MF3/22]EJC99606.1 ketoacyl-synt-domain-containing protein [Fomitiporia mediterranea MF3/22]